MTSLIELPHYSDHTYSTHTCKLAPGPGAPMKIQARNRGSSSGESSFR